MTASEQPSAQTQPRRPAEQVWVLAGSVGSVAAIGRFFRALPPAGQSLAFVVAVRSSVEAARLLVRLLAKTTPFAVHTGGLERTLYPRDLLFVPTDDDTPAAVAPDGSVHHPHGGETLDRVLLTVAERYRGHAGAIVFSGIGLDGADGCRSIIRQGGQVWTQDEESSRYRTLPHYIREVCDVSLSAAPEALAVQLARGEAPRLQPASGPAPGSVAGKAPVSSLSRAPEPSPAPV
jgi:chemosensory pili system protein ChpB (putative protein-glutamate methylesterase)